MPKQSRKNVGEIFKNTGLLHFVRNDDRGAQNDEDTSVILNEVKDPTGASGTVGFFAGAQNDKMALRMTRRARVMTKKGAVLEKKGRKKGVKL